MAEGDFSDSSAAAPEGVQPEQAQEQPATAVPGVRSHMPSAPIGSARPPGTKLQGEKLDPAVAAQADAAKPLPTVRSHMPSAPVAAAPPGTKLQGEKLDPAVAAQADAAKPLPTVRQYMPSATPTDRRPKLQGEKLDPAVADRNAAAAAKSTVRSHLPPKPEELRKKIAAKAPPPAAAAPPEPAAAQPVAEQSATQPAAPQAAPVQPTEQPAAAQPLEPAAPPPPPEQSAEQPVAALPPEAAAPPLPPEQPATHPAAAPAAAPAAKLRPSRQVSVKKRGLLARIFGRKPRPGNREYATSVDSRIAQISKGDMHYKPLAAVAAADRARQAIPAAADMVATLDSDLLRESLQNGACEIRLVAAAIKAAPALTEKGLPEAIMAKAEDIDEVEAQEFCGMLRQGAELLMRIGELQHQGGAPFCNFGLLASNPYAALAAGGKLDAAADVKLREWLILCLDTSLAVCDMLADAAQGIRTARGIDALRQNAAALEAASS